VLTEGATASDKKATRLAHFGVSTLESTWCSQRRMKTGTWVSSIAWGFIALACASQPSEPAAAPEPIPPAEPPAALAAETPAAAESAAAPTAAAPRTIEVPLEAKSGSKLTGKAVLTETEGGVHVLLTVEGIEPGDHGAHVHEKGDCSSPDGKSAGGHFNPQSKDHGLPGADKRHLGDLGNITIGKDGKGSLDITAPGANLKESDPQSFVGRAIIVHAKKDDGGQPVGNAGDRQGCGVIKG
jgi:Cu-Zn family superoxide dismutase